MTKVIANTYEVASANSRRIALVFAAASAFLIILYVINVYSVISKTVSLQNVQAEIAAVSRSVESLDSKYLDLSSRITPDGLSLYGFREGKVSAYISRTAPLTRVAISGNEL